jgi:hypothetical protein
MHAVNGAAFGRFLHYFSVLSLIVLAGCGGGGGETNNGNPTPSNPQPQPNRTVGGSVSAPNAAVAFSSELSTKQRSTRLSSVSTQAALNGAVPVPDGTLVELGRIDSSGNILEVILSTRTSGGQYTFDLEEMGLEISSDLIVRAVNENGSVQMRAFLTHETVDIDPVSETTFRLLFNGNYIINLDQLSTDELARIAATIQLFVRTQNFTVLSDLETTVSGLMAHSK